MIDMSSADPVGTRATPCGPSRSAASRLVDAPVSGGVPRATDGSLAIMIGGDAAAVAAAKPVLSKMGTRLFEVGGPGNGHAMKALNNFVAGTGFIAVAEAVLVGKSFGLDPAVMIDVMNASTGKQLQHRERREAARDLRASSPPASRLACSPRTSGSLPTSPLRSTCRARSPACPPRCSARRATGWSREDHTLAYTYWESRDKKAAAE